MIKKFIKRLFDIHPDAMSFKQGLDLTGVPVITLYQDSDKPEPKKFNFILDTGSDVCVIDSSALDSINHSIVENAQGKMYGIDGKRHQTKVCSITLEYKGKSYSDFYLVQDCRDCLENIKNDHGVTVHGFIGSRFFNKYKYVLDFDELIAYSKQ